MKLEVEIDKGSGFCAGVIRAINTAEKYLKEHSKLYSLGAIVHNESELARLHQQGLETINIQNFKRGSTVLIRAHGEPPSTYQLAQKQGIQLIDCTCPVVLQLQKSIVEAYQRLGGKGTVVIFGKVGHAEVLGLLGQVAGDAIVVENAAMLQEAIQNKKIDLTRPIEVFSQTTKSPSEYEEICAELKTMIASACRISQDEVENNHLLTTHHTICLQVANRHSKLSRFAFDHDVILFVSGKESSNGKVLFELCKSVNPRTYHISSQEDIHSEWFCEGNKVGICGATSTPKWLLEDVARFLKKGTQSFD